MNKTIYIILAVLLISCGNDGDMWREKVDVGNGAYIYLYHTEKCTKSHPLFSVSEKMIEYQKMKYDVFDLCFSKEQLKMLTEISRTNIAEYKRHALEFCEDKDDLDYYSRYYSRKKTLLDTGKCDYSTEYSIQNGKLVKLKNKWLP